MANDFPQGLIIKMLLAEETHNIFLLTKISDINIFFIKKDNGFFFCRNVYDNFASTT